MIIFLTKKIISEIILKYFFEVRISGYSSILIEFLCLKFSFSESLSCWNCDSLKLKLTEVFLLSDYILIMLLFLKNITSEIFVCLLDFAVFIDSISL